MYELQNLQKMKGIFTGSSGRNMRATKQLPNYESRGTKSSKNLLLDERSETEDYNIHDSITPTLEAGSINTKMKEAREKKSVPSLPKKPLNSSSSPLERRSVWSGTSSFWPVTSENSEIPMQGPLSCCIDTQTLYNFSVRAELKSALIMSSWIMLCTICGIGYEGRTTISKTFGILETIHIYPGSLGSVAASYTVFEIAHETLHRWLILLQLLIYHAVLITAIQLELLVYGHVLDAAIACCFVVVTYIFCSSKFYIRAFYYLVWSAGIAIMFSVVLILLNFELWEWILIISIPTDILINKLAVLATKTCDRLSFLQVSSLYYCAIFEDYRFLSLLSIVKQEYSKCGLKFWKSWNLKRFFFLDFLCIFIMKSEIIYFIKKNTEHIFSAQSKTEVLSARVTRGCVNVATICLPIWWFGFELGRYLMSERDHTTQSEHLSYLSELTTLVLLMQYGPELASRLPLLLMRKIYANYTNWRLERINFIASLENGLLILAYGMVPSSFLMMMIVIVKE